MDKRIRGLTFSTHVPQGFEFEMLCAAHKILGGLLHDVFITTDHRIRPPAGKSRGYGISLIAETTSGCVMSCDTTVSYGYEEGAEEQEVEEKKHLKPPEDVGEEMAALLLSEIKRGGVVDSTTRYNSCSRSFYVYLLDNPLILSLKSYLHVKSLPYYGYFQSSEI